MFSENLAVCDKCQTRTALQAQSTLEEVMGLQEKANASKSRSVSRNLKSEAVALLKSQSMMSQRSVLTKFPFSNLHSSLDYHAAFTFEPLHNFHLGVGKLIKQCVTFRLDSKSLFSTEITTSFGEPRAFSSIKSDVLLRVNSALKSIQSESHQSSFRIDFENAKSTQKLNAFYTKDGVASMLEAKDYATLDQVFPLLEPWWTVYAERLCSLQPQK